MQKRADGVFAGDTYKLAVVKGDNVTLGRKAVGKWRKITAVGQSLTQKKLVYKWVSIAVDGDRARGRGTYRL